MQRKTLCIDFDGVIHSYSSGWQGATVIPDRPVTGAFKWLRKIINTGKYHVCIYSSRSKEIGGIAAMKAWFDRWEFSTSNLDFPTEKPAAWITLDDRAICFQGKFPSQRTIDNFKPWYK